MIKLIIWVGAGGFLGSVSRFLASRYISAFIPASFPFGTFLINTIGCLLIGLIFGVAERGNFLSSEWRMFLTVGFCGGFTTFSAFAVENIALLRNADYVNFLLYSGGSVFFGILAALAGMLLIKIL